MKIAFLTYQYVNNPNNIPSEWPAEIMEIGDSDPAPSVNHQVMTNEEFATYKAARQTAYNSWLAAFNASQNTLDPYLRLLEAAKRFGNGLMDIAAAENIAMGITQAGKTKLVADTLKDVSFYLSTGSLYEALSAIDAIVITPEMSPFITSTRILAFKNKIRAYLGLPLL